MQKDDDEIIRALLGSDRKNKDEALRQFLTDRPWALNHVRQHGGSHEDGEDVFQDAVALLYEKVRENKFQGKSSLRTFFHRIVEWRWYSLKRKLRPQEVVSAGFEPEQREAAPDETFMREEEQQIVQKGKEMLGEKCREVLRLSEEGISQGEIAKELSFQSTNAVKQQARRCREQLKEFIRKML